MGTAGYNSRPRTGGKYKNGKKRSLFTRIIMWFFPWKGDGLFEAARKIIFLGALVCFVYFTGGIVHEWAYDVYREYVNTEKMRNFFGGSVNLDDDIRDDILRKKPEILPDYISFYHDNNDLVGHIMIPNLSSPLPFTDPGKYTINYMVYQRLTFNENGERNGDNHYYLEHAFDHSPSAGGSIFADFRNDFEDGSLPGNTILYGHNMYTGNYFAKVSHYYKGFESRDLTFYKNHPLITFNTIYEENDWKVFATVLFNTESRHGEPYRYLIPEFRDKEHFNQYILDIMDRSVLFTDVDIEYGDHILTLSTCYYPFGTSVDTRAVVFARKVRPGESSHVDVSKAAHNTAYLPFDTQRQRMGNNWSGRVWDTSYLLSYNGE
ncbi:MAG: class B sortase [Oscillospiraceae bacterium]|nr:class B sortase [Oscillospiraceae bacterium]